LKIPDKKVGNEPPPILVDSTVVVPKKPEKLAQVVEAKPKATNLVEVCY